MNKTLNTIIKTAQDEIETAKATMVNNLEKSSFLTKEEKQSLKKDSCYYNLQRLEKVVAFRQYIKKTLGALEVPNNIRSYENSIYYNTNMHEFLDDTKFRNAIQPCIIELSIMEKLSKLEKYAIGKDDKQYNEFKKGVQGEIINCKTSDGCLDNLKRIEQKLDNLDEDLNKTVPYLKQVIQSFKEYLWGWGWWTYYKGLQIEEKLKDIPFDQRGRSNFVSNQEVASEQQQSLKNAMAIKRFTCIKGDKETKTTKAFKEHLNLTPKNH